MFAIYDFNIKFIFKLASQEKLACNRKILNYIIETKKFWIFIRKYCLRDTKYLNLYYFFLLWKKSWYYLNKQKLALSKYTNIKKLFNLYYAYLYNVIKQIFSIVKCQF